MKKNVTLDEYQKKAVETPGNILLIAGAGAGKTFTITKKIGYLINNKPIFDTCNKKSHTRSHKS